MKKTIWIVVVIVILAVAVFLFGQKQATAPETAESPTPTPTQAVPTPTPQVSPTATPDSAQPTPSSQNFEVIFADGAVSPTSLNIKVGDSVTFINNDDRSHWPASGVHPAHQICKGFDALEGLNEGDTYSFTFNEAKTCPFHDHLNPSINGQITVSP